MHTPQINEISCTLFFLLGLLPGMIKYSWDTGCVIYNTPTHELLMNMCLIHNRWHSISVRPNNVNNIKTYRRGVRLHLRCTYPTSDVMCLIHKIWYVVIFKVYHFYFDNTRYPLASYFPEVLLLVM